MSYNLERQREWLRKHPGYSAALSRKRRIENPAENRWHRANTQSRTDGHASPKDYMSKGEFKAWYNSQPQECAICGKTEKLVLDHDHKTGKPRGILCSRCNIAEGMLLGSPVIAMKLAQYMLDNE